MSTPHKSLPRPSSPPRGASPAISRVPNDFTTPTLPNLRRPSDFGSPGVAVASAAGSRNLAMSLSAQDDAMEMLLQVTAPPLFVQSFTAHFIPFAVPASQKLASTSIDADARVDAVRQQLQVSPHQLRVYPKSPWLRRVCSSALQSLSLSSATGAGARFRSASPSLTGQRRRLPPSNSTTLKHSSGGPHCRQQPRIGTSFHYWAGGGTM